MKTILRIALLSLFLSACGGMKKADTVVLEEIEVVGNVVDQRPNYQAEVQRNRRQVGYSTVAANPFRPH